MEIIRPIGRTESQHHNLPYPLSQCSLGHTLAHPVTRLSTGIHYLILLTLACVVTCGQMQYT